MKTVVALLGGLSLSLVTAGSAFAQEVQVRACRPSSTISSACQQQPYGQQPYGQQPARPAIRPAVRAPSAAGAAGPGRGAVGVRRRPGLRLGPRGRDGVHVESTPYVYVYTPSYGWNWVVSPWGFGPYYAGAWIHRPWYVGRGWGWGPHFYGRGWGGHGYGGHGYGGHGYGGHAYGGHYGGAHYGGGFHGGGFHGGGGHGGGGHGGGHR